VRSSNRRVPPASDPVDVLAPHTRKAIGPPWARHARSATRSISLAASSSSREVHRARGRSEQMGRPARADRESLAEPSTDQTACKSSVCGCMRKAASRGRRRGAAFSGLYLRASRPARKGQMLPISRQFVVVPTAGFEPAVSRLKGVSTSLVKRPVLQGFCVPSRGVLAALDYRCGCLSGVSAAKWPPAFSCGGLWRR
jgi:hypothetical protein